MQDKIKAAMQYSFAFTEETITVDGYQIEIWHDQDTSNPYEDSDGMAPALWLSLGNGFKEYGRADLESPFDRFTLHQVSRHWRAIAAILDLDESAHDQEAREHSADYGQSLAESRKDLFQDALGNMRAETWGYGCDYLEALRALYRLMGYPADTFEKSGYCQGDVVRGLIVWTPEWVKAMGCNPARAAKDMESEAATYGAWVRGDCYGYTVTRDGQDVGSCGGFIGGTDSGLLEYLASDIESDKRQCRARLKEMIRGRAPLEARAAFLAGV